MTNLFYFFSAFRNGLYVVLSGIDNLTKSNKNQTIVLCYHSFDNDDWYHGVSVKSLEQQLQYLTAYYQPITASGLERILSGQSAGNNFLLTIDDGYADVMNAKPIFDKFGVKPVLFLLSDRTGVNRKEMDNNKKLLNDKQIQQLIEAGWDLGSHGATHSDFYNLTDNQIHQEVVESRAILKEKTNTDIGYFAYPKGRYTDNIVKAVKKTGYLFGFSMDDGFVGKNTNRYIIPRIGVNRSHNMLVFKSMISPSNIVFRKMVKPFLGGII